MNLYKLIEAICRGALLLFCLITQAFGVVAPRATVSRKAPVARQISVPSMAVKISTAADVQPSTAAPITSDIQALNTAFKEKLQSYEKQFAAFSTSTDGATIEKGVSDFIAEIITPAITNVQVSLNNIDAAKALIEKLLSLLTNVNSQLGQVASGDLRRNIISDKIHILKKNETELSNKVGGHKALYTKLTEARRIPITQFDQKIPLYSNFNKLITQATLDSTKFEFIKDMEWLAAQAQKKGGAQLASFNQFKAEVEANNAFSEAQKQMIADVFVARPATVSLGSASTGTMAGVSGTTVAAGGKGDPVFQRRLAEITAQRKLYEKISDAKSLLTLITAATSQIDKNSFVTFCNNVWLQVSTMNRRELEELRELFKEIQIHQLFLSASQRPIVERWEKSLSLMIEISDDKNILLTNVKEMLNQDKKNYGQALKAAICGVTLLSTKLPPQDLGKADKGSLTALLRDKIQAFYNGRANRPMAELRLLFEFLNTAKNKKSLVDRVVKKWVDLLALEISIFEAQAETDSMRKLDALEKVFALLKPASDRYEKGLFITELTTFFTNRKDRAEAELEKFNALLVRLTSPENKNKKLFSVSDFAKIEEWKSVLKATLILLNATIEKNNTKTIESVGGLFEAALEKDKKASAKAGDLSSIVWKKSDYERSLLVPILSELFFSRGDCTKAELIKLKKFFEIIKKAANTLLLLSVEQTIVLEKWLKELDSAIAITAESGTYIEGVLVSAAASKNMTMYSNALNLLTEKTSKDVKKKIHAGLSELHAQMKSFDPNNLRVLFTNAYDKRVGRDYAFESYQRVDLESWIKELDLAAPIVKKK